MLEKPARSTSPPESYRFQVHSIENVTCAHCGAVTPKTSSLLWEEPPGREIAWVLSARVAAANDHAQRLANEYRARVALGTKYLHTDAPVLFETIVHPDAVRVAS